MNDSVHTSQLLDVSANDISRNDTTDELDHTVRDTRDDVTSQTMSKRDDHIAHANSHGEQPIRIPVSILCFVVGSVELELTTGRSVDDEHDGGNQTKCENGV